MDLGAVLRLSACPRKVADFDQGDARLCRLELQQLNQRLELGVEHGFINVNHNDDVLCDPALARA
jgi:hypothetical protein